MVGGCNGSASSRSHSTFYIQNSILVCRLKTQAPKLTHHSGSGAYSSASTDHVATTASTARLSAGTMSPARCSRARASTFSRSSAQCSSDPKSPQAVCGCGLSSAPPGGAVVLRRQWPPTPGPCRSSPTPPWTRLRTRTRCLPRLARATPRRRRSRATATLP